jgi:bifunctional DNA-binding transcriptional regulator/antitoxin component of YhaV-PrlF toxin-antitoxin module
MTVKIEKNGKILLPANVRRILGIRDGESDLLLTVDETRKSITVETRDRALTRIRNRIARYIPEGTLLSEELLSDRREEASLE